MAPLAGTPIPITRFLGVMDQDDQTNLPLGLCWIAYDVEYSLTSVRTRAGIQKTIQGINNAPITGLLGINYSPETADESFFQLPLLFDYLGTLQAESPCGVGKTTAIAPTSGSSMTMLPFPASAQMIAIQAYGRAYMAFSDLLTPKAQMSVLAMDGIAQKWKTPQPYGLKPYGWRWTKNSNVFLGEICTPTVTGGNGHTYQCVQSGTTGGTEPVWPTTVSGQIGDGSAAWQEMTIIAANRIPEPTQAPTVALEAGGSLGSGNDIYVAYEWANQNGNTLFSPISTVVTTDSGHQTIQVTIPDQSTWPQWVLNLAPFKVFRVWVYTAIVTHGASQPGPSSYKRAGFLDLPITGPLTISATPTGPAPVPYNGARLTSGKLFPPTTAPTVQVIAGSGSTFTANDVYVAYSLISPFVLIGIPESSLSPTSVAQNLDSTHIVQVNMPVVTDEIVAQIEFWGAVVPAGAPPPPTSSYGSWGKYAYDSSTGQYVLLVGTPTPSNPPVAQFGNNTSIYRGSIVKDQPQSLLNTGFRYINLSFVNFNGTYSGMAEEAAAPVNIDYNGFELWIGNIPKPPANCPYVQVTSSEADAVPAGPYFGSGEDGVVLPFLYPSVEYSFGEPMTSMLLAAGTKSATLNFSDSYLISTFSYTDRLDCIWPLPGIDVYYSKETDRIVVTGAPGYYSGHWFSLAADPETQYGADKSFLTVGNNDGERTWCAREFANVLFSFRERSAYVITPENDPTTGLLANPAQWRTTERWSGMGPCGPRAIAVTKNFLIFVHENGVYRYSREMAQPDLVSKEIPRFWATINWTAAQNIWVDIDEKMHCVHIGVPLGESTVPNLEIIINYLEGWQNPIHFSSWSQKEITLEAARRYSFNRISAWMATRVYRKNPALPALDFSNPQGVEGIVIPDRSFLISQYLYCTSGNDGGVHASCPGIYNDNGSGIQSLIETICARNMLALTKPNGISMNARGEGRLLTWLIAGRVMIEDPGAGDISADVQRRIVPMEPYDLSPDQSEGISLGASANMQEQWRVRISTDGQPNSWFDLKYLEIYMPIVAQSREFRSSQT